MAAKRVCYFASDGAGEQLKETIIAHLKSKECYEIHDLGTDTYYDAAAKVGKAVGAANDSTGLLFCGTGMGVGIMANKFSGVRAATCEHVLAATSARAINNANVLCLGQLVTPPETAIPIVDAFLSHEFLSCPYNDQHELVPWWSQDVETSLKPTMEGVQRVEEESKEALKSE